MNGWALVAIAVFGPPFQLLLGMMVTRSIFIHNNYNPTVGTIVGGIAGFFGFVPLIYTWIVLSFLPFKDDDRSKYSPEIQNWAVMAGMIASNFATIFMMVLFLTSDNTLDPFGSLLWVFSGSTTLLADISGIYSVEITEKLVGGLLWTLSGQLALVIGPAIGIPIYFSTRDALHQWATRLEIDPEINVEALEDLRKPVVPVATPHETPLQRIFRQIGTGFSVFIRTLMVPIDFYLSGVQKWLGIRQMAYFFVMPNMFIFGIFILLPMLLNFYYGFTQGNSILLENREYVGTDNLSEILNCDNYTDPNTCEEDYFWRGVRNTFVFVTAQVMSMVVLALITALALNRKVVLRGFFRSIFFYPVLLSPVVVALIWRWFLDFDAGLLNTFIETLGGNRTRFLSDPDNSNWARFWVIAVADWAYMGFYTLILLAGLQSIPPVLYEAAEIDGANGWQRFWRVTLPLLMPTMTVVLVLAMIRAVQAFDQVFVLTGGGPGTATLYIVQYIYRAGFIISPPDYGMAAAASLLLAGTLLIITLAQLYFARRSEAT